MEVVLVGPADDASAGEGAAAVPLEGEEDQLADVIAEEEDVLRTGECSPARSCASRASPSVYLLTLSARADDAPSEVFRQALLAAAPRGPGELPPADQLALQAARSTAHLVRSTLEFAALSGDALEQLRYFRLLRAAALGAK